MKASIADLQVWEFSPWQGKLFMVPPRESLLHIGEAKELVVKQFNTCTRAVIEIRVPDALYKGNRLLLGSKKWNPNLESRELLGGSGVVISGVTSPLIWIVSIVTTLITLLISTHEPPSTHQLHEGIQTEARVCNAQVSWGTLNFVWGIPDHHRVRKNFGSRMGVP